MDASGWQPGRYPRIVGSRRRMLIGVAGRQGPPPNQENLAGCGVRRNSRTKPAKQQRLLKLLDGSGLRTDVRADAVPLNSTGNRDAKVKLRAGGPSPKPICVVMARGECGWPPG